MEGIENLRERVGRGVSKAQEIREGGGRGPEKCKNSCIKDGPLSFNADQDIVRDQLKSCYCRDCFYFQGKI